MKRHISWILLPTITFCFSLSAFAMEDYKSIDLGRRVRINSKTGRVTQKKTQAFDEQKLDLGAVVRRGASGKFENVKRAAELAPLTANTGKFDAEVTLRRHFVQPDVIHHANLPQLGAKVPEKKEAGTVKGSFDQKVAQAAVEESVISSQELELLVVPRSSECNSLKLAPAVIKNIRANRKESLRYWNYDHYGSDNDEG